jgi:hypothetical protein
MRSWERTALLVVVVGLLAIVTAPSTVAAASVSGMVVSVEGDRIVIADVGPWQIERGETKITPRSVAITGSTEVVRVQRTDEPDANGWPGGFATSAASGIPALKHGDFVAVDVTDEGGRLIATKLTIVSVAGS